MSLTLQQCDSKIFKNLIFLILLCQNVIIINQAGFAIQLITTGTAIQIIQIRKFVYKGK